MELCGLKMFVCLSDNSIETSDIFSSTLWCFGKNFSMTILFVYFENQSSKKASSSKIKQVSNKFTNPSTDRVSFYYEALYLIQD